MPVPLTDSIPGELEAVLENEIDPDIVPLLWGVKPTLTERLCPGARVSGSVAPVKINCELLLVADETVTLAAVAVIVTGKVSVVPTATLPYFNDAGVSVS